jgi:hypothetical protein
MEDGMRSGLPCFVGRLPRREDAASLRQAIVRGFEQHEYISLEFADDYLQNGEPDETLRRAIDRAVFCVFEISGFRRANVFLELGYALGRGRCPILLLRNGYRTPDHLSGHQMIVYSSTAKVRQALRQVHVFPQVVAALGELCEAADSASFDRGLIALVATGLLRESLLGPSQVFNLASSRGFSEEQVLYTLEALNSIGMVEPKGVGWEITEQGARHLPRLLEEAHSGTS